MGRPTGRYGLVQVRVLVRVTRVVVRKGEVRPTVALVTFYTSSPL